MSIDPTDRPPVPGMRLKTLCRRLIRYGIIGAFSTLTHLLAAFLFICFIQPSLLLSNLFGFGWAYLFSYFFQSRWVFESDISLRKALKYLLVQLLALFTAMGCSTLAAAFNVHFKVLLTAVILPLISFLIHQAWTFAGGTPEKTEM